jgi:cytochrome c oxidase subunit II
LREHPGPPRRVLLSAATAALFFFLAAARAAAQETFQRTTIWLPADYSERGPAIDHLFDFILWMTLIVGVAVFGVMIYFLVKYRHRPGRHALYTHGNTKLELVWTLVPTLILAATAAFSQNTWSQIKYHENAPHDDPAHPENNPIHVHVVGKQFKWYFHYAGKDGKFGRTLDPKLVNREAAEPEKIIGLDRSDPAGKDDIVSVLMYVPVNRQVVVDLDSVDVIHSFFLPHFRVKQDAMPGLHGKVWFEALRTCRQAVGENDDAADSSKGQAAHPIWGYQKSPKPFDIVCAELCGQGHFTMRGSLYVVSQDEYDRFLKQEASYLGGGDFGF